MADIREKLAEALAEHYEIAARRFADVLLSLPGIAIVELPQMAGVNSLDNAVWYREPYTEQSFDGEVVISDRVAIGVEHLRPFAAALLAAAAAAEAGDK
ncbi:hypothetical protein [Mycobacterium marinum]|uniref:hypothetical protein n=1 Tax=Mycobacterium marinum TaxID=1781 RepID=UPI0035626028